MLNMNHALQNRPIGLYVIGLLYLSGAAFVAFTEPHRVGFSIALLTVILVFGLYYGKNWARLITLIFVWLTLAIGIFRLMVLMSGTRELQVSLSLFVIYGVELIGLMLNGWIAYYLTRPHVAKFYGVASEATDASAPCPYCQKPLRTAAAKQCPHCLMDWHDSSNPKQLIS